MNHLVLSLFLPFALLSPVSSFTRSSLTFSNRRHTVCHESSGSFEYEYLPPNPDADPGGETTINNLPSSYPPDTPASLRGEAVRSALLSGRCIGWNLSSTSLLSMGGILQVQGKGMRDFLNNKLTQEFSTGTESYQEACLLDAKGRVVDRLRVSIVDTDTALILTSPGHSSQKLLERLDPFIFPLDQIELTNYDNDQSFIFTLASPQWKDIEKVITEQTDLPSNAKSFSFPSRPNQHVQWELDNDTKVLVIPSTGLPSVACVGYTFVFYGKNTNSVGSKLWNHLIGESNMDGPINVGALEYESLRVEAGQPAFGKEIGLTKDLKTSPLEIHWQDETINMDKGCYLGQEGIASTAKNPRGPPRTLYQVMFEDDLNIYESQSRGDNSGFENLTKPPKSGDKLFALGSNEQLSVGTLTSVAEAGGSGDRNIYALALIRRADSIMKRMKEFDLEIPSYSDDFVDMVDDGSGMIAPPPMDPLDGLEVIVEESFTVGTLKVIPSRRIRRGGNMFDDSIVVDDLEASGTKSQSEEGEIVVTQSPTSDDDNDFGEIQKGTEEASLLPEFVSIQKTKTDTSELLRKRAEQAKEEEAALAEAKRKEEKMELLKKRAEEALARRKKKAQDKNNG